MNLTTWADHLPRVDAADSTAALFADPYRFISLNAMALGTDLFQARLMGQPTLCATGAAAAEMFYDASRIQRHGAAPEPLQATLFGKGAIQGLDGLAHRHRKAMFLQVLDAAGVQSLVAEVRRVWLAAVPTWPADRPFSLYRALQPILTQAVCDWAGVPIVPDDLRRRSQSLTALFDSAARGPVQHLKARVARKSAEHWLTLRIQEIRAGRLHPPAGSALAVVAHHHDEHGTLLSDHIAAVELLNVLRPVVAVSLYMTFVAHALQVHPEWPSRLRRPESRRDALHFVQEVRRFYPFFPALAGQVKQTFEWQGLTLPAGMRLLMDIHGTHHDARAWTAPDQFNPDRWRDLPEPPRFAFLAQGGADAATHHRCPGEDSAVALMLLTLEMLLQRLRYQVPTQDLSLDFTRLPALPRDAMQLSHVSLV